MNKKDFQKTFWQEDPYRMAKLYEALDRAKDYDFFYYTDEFYPPHITEEVLRMKDFRGVEALGPSFLERRVFGVHAEGMMPYSIIAMENVDAQITLTHKDYLGAIMALGLQREKFGDLYVKGNVAYLVLLQERAPYLVEQLSQVGRATVSVTVHAFDEVMDVVTPSLKTIEKVVASRRLDVLVAEMAKLSRTKAVELISSGRVLVNYHVVKERAKEIRDEDTLTIRGVGKFKIGEVLKETQKGNLLMRFYQFY